MWFRRLAVFDQMGRQFRYSFFLYIKKKKQTCKMTKCRMAVLQACHGDLLVQIPNVLCRTDHSTYPFKAENNYLPPASG